MSLVLSWQAPHLRITVTDAGLASLQFKGHELLANGTFLVDSIAFDGPDLPVSANQVVKRALAGKEQVLTTYPWGSITNQYAVNKSSLQITTTIVNQSQSTIRSLRVTPLVLRFARKPDEYDGSVPLLATNIGAPTAISLTTDAQRLVVTNDDPQRPLLIGFPWASDRPASLTYPLRIVTGREPMYPDIYPAVDRPIAPGQKDEYRISLHFGAKGQPVAQLAADLLERYTHDHPATLDWQDRRPIASLIIGTAAAGWPGNPRGWFLDGKLDVNSKAGVAEFQRRLLEWADRSIANMHEMNAQGMITWDIEGEQFPHPVTYVGDPRLAEQLAPEMSGAIDKYFARFHDAGLRVGVTVRPQEFHQSDGAAPSQRAVADPAALLISKIQYARDRWKATLFYVDSNGLPGFPIDAAIFEKVHAAVPNVLLIPEHKNLLYYASTAPYAELRQGFAGTPALPRSVYPRAFSVINVTDGPFEQRRAELEQAVRAGDILLFRGWYQDQNAAGVKSLAP